MQRLELRPVWGLRGEDGEQSLQRIFELLAAVAAEGNLSRACAHLGISYRHGWDLVRRGAKLVGAPLVRARRGRAAQLTELGGKLVWTHRRAMARLAPLMESAASELESEIRQSAKGAKPPLRVQASYAFALVALLQEHRRPCQV